MKGVNGFIKTPPNAFEGVRGGEWLFIREAGIQHPA